MAEGGENYELKLGVNTSGAAADASNLKEEIKAIGHEADASQAKIDKASGAISKHGAAAKTASNSIVSAAGSNDKLTASVAKTEGSVAKTSSAMGKMSSTAGAAEASIAKTAKSTDGLTSSSQKATTSISGAVSATDKMTGSSNKAGVSIGRTRDEMGKFVSAADKMAAAAAKGETGLSRSSSTSSRFASIVGGLETTIMRLVKAVDSLTGATGKNTTALEREGRVTRTVADGLDRVSSSANKADVSLGKMVRGLAAATATWFSLSSAMAAGTSLITTLNTYEGTLIGVTKTTGLAGNDLKKFYGDVLQMSTGSVPLATKDLLEMAGAAGSLGVSGAKNITEYAETIGQLSAASEDLKGAEAATLLTRLMNVQGEGPENVERLASVIVALGLSSAATEREIAVIATEVGKATASFKIGSTTAAAYGAALAEMGIQSELGGSAIGRTMREMQTAVTEGKTQLANFATVAGVSAEEFKKAFQSDANGAFMLFIRGLADYGTEGGVALERLGLSGDELAKVLPTLATNYDKFAEKIRIANAEAGSMGALQDKAGIAFDSTAADLQRLANGYDAVKLSIAQGFAPAIRDVAEELTLFAMSSREGGNALGQELAPIIRHLGDAVLLLARNIDVLTSALAAFLILKAFTWFAALIAGIIGAIKALQAKIVASRAATAAAAQQAEAEWALAFSLDAGRTKAALAAQGNLALAASNQAATASGTAFLSTAITPLAIGLTALLGVLIYANSQIVEFAANSEAAIRAMVASTNDLAESINKLKGEAKAALDETRKADEIKRRMLEQGVKPGRSERDDAAALRINNQVELDFQRNRTKLLYDNEAALTENKAALEEYRGELARLREEEKKYQGIQNKEKENFDLDSGGGVSQRGREAGAMLAQTRERIKEFEVAANGANAKVNTLESNIGELRKVTEAFVPPAEAAGKTIDGLAGKADKAAEKFSKLAGSIADATQRNLDVARAYEKGGLQAGRTAEQNADLQARKSQAAIDLKGKEKAAIEAGTEALVLSERTLAGSKTIAVLDNQILSAGRLKIAYEQGIPAAIEDARREWDLLEATLQNTTGAAEEQIPKIVQLTGELVHLEGVNAFQEQAYQARMANKALSDAAKQWDGTAESIERSTIVLQINNDIQQQTINLTQAEAEELGKLIRERIRLEALFESRMRLGKLEEEGRRLREIAAVRRSDFRTEREYQEAIRKTNVEHEVRSALLSVMFDKMKILTATKREDFDSEELYQASLAETERVYGDIAKRTEAAVRGNAELTHQLALQDETLVTTTQKWGRFADGLTNLSGVDEQFRGIAEGLSQVIKGFIQASEAIDKFGRSQGWAAAAQGVYGLAAASGVLNHNVSNGGFGGRGEGNYSEEGSSIGAVIGGIIGAYYGNAAAGMAIGSAAGGILGAFVKKGAEESLGKLKLDSGDIVAAITKDEGSLGRTLSELGSRISEAIHGILDTLGGEIDGVPEMSVKVRDGIISVWVGMVNTRVRDMDDAITFAVTEILKQADISGLSEVMRKILSRTTAMDLDQLGKDLEFGQWYENLGLEDAAVAVQQQVAAFRAKMRQAWDMDLDAAPIGEWLGRQLNGIRDQLLGIEVDPAEVVRRNAEAFNAQVRIIEAEAQLRRSDLLAKKADLEAKLGLAAAERKLDQAKLLTQLQMLGTEEAIVRAMGSSGAALSAILQAMMAVDEALRSVDALLGNLPNLISEEEINTAIGRIGRGGSGGTDVAEERRTFKEELRDIARGTLPETVRSMRELGDQLRELTRRNRELHGTEQDLRAARQALIEQARREVIDLIRGDLTPAEGGTFGMNQWQEEEAEIRRRMQEARDANAAMLQETGQRAIEFWRINEAEIRAMKKLAEDAVDSLGLPLESARDRMRDLGNTIAFLRKSMKEGALAVADFDRAMAELSQQAEVELLGMAATLLDQMGRFDEADKVRRAADEINFHLQRLEFNILYAQYMSLGLISDALKDRFEELFGIINDPANWPDFNSPAPTRGGGGGTGEVAPDMEWTKVRDEIAAQAKAWRETALTPALKTARDLRLRFEELSAAGQKFNLDLRELTAAFGIARAKFINDSLSDFEHLGESDLRKEDRELRERFADLEAAFVEIGATAKEWERLEQARIAAFADMWARATEGIRNILDEIEQSDRRRSGRDAFVSAQQNFRSLAARARAGDLDAVAELEAAIQRYREASTAFLGGGVGSDAVIDEILSLRDIVGTSQDPVVNGITVSNDILTQIRDLMSTWVAASEEGGGVARTSMTSADSDRSSVASSGRAWTGGSIAVPDRFDAVAGGSWVSGPDGYTLTPPGGAARAEASGGAAVERAIERLARERRERDDVEDRRRAAGDPRVESQSRRGEDKLMTSIATLVAELQKLTAEMKRNRPPAGT